MAALCFIAFTGKAQKSVISGNISEDGVPVQGAIAKMQGTGMADTSDASGNFRIENVEYGDYILEISFANNNPSIKHISVNQPETKIENINFLSSELRYDSDNIPVISLSESELKEESGASVAGVLSASRDAFTSAASFGWSIARFRFRGYERDNFTTLINGAPMTDLTTGNTMYYSWSGLNDVMRSRENVSGLAPAGFTFGEIGGSTFIDSRASRQRKQLQASYSISNRSYDNRVMATYGTGILQNGWSFALSGSHRWANEGYIPGTFYDGWSYFGTAEKQIGMNHSVSLTAMGAPGKFGKSSPAVQEMYDLAGTNYYNPSWGWQAGEKRNSKVGRNDLKTFILSHEWKISDLTSLFSSASMVTGKSKSSALDWYNAANPYPDYYRNLPSFDTTTQVQTTAYLQSNDSLLQLDWQAMYAANALSDTTVEDANGIKGNSVSGKWSQYILQNYVTDYKIYNFNSFINTVFSDHVALHAGINAAKQKTEFYREVNDLLGGDFYVDINKYVQQDNPDNFNIIQNDLNTPNKVLKKGDRFGYDYVADIQKVSGWWQTLFTYNKIDFFIAANFSHTSFLRDGKYKNGLFPEASFGKSPKQNFTNYGFKGGATYKINGSNYVFANAAYLTEAPLFDNIFISPRTRNFLTPGAADEKIFSSEGGYLLKAPRIKGRLTGYLTEMKDGILSKTFFNESTNSFGTLVLTGADKRHIGTEISAEAQVGYGVSVSAAASLGQYFYTSNPKGTFSEDENAQAVLSDVTVYSRNFRIAGSPQKAYSATVSYRSKNFWFVNLTFNYFGDLYIDFSPIRRTTPAVDFVEPDSPLYSEIFSQQKADAKFTMDLFGGWSWKMNNKIKALKRNSFLVINAGVTNLLDEKDFITNGYEQLRFDFENKNPNKYAPKYFYAFGRTYFVNIAFRFN